MPDTVDSRCNLMGRNPCKFLRFDFVEAATVDATFLKEHVPRYLAQDSEDGFVEVRVSIEPFLKQRLWVKQQIDIRSCCL